MIKHVTYPAIILSIFLAKLIIIPVTIGDALVFLGMIALFGLYRWVDYKRGPDINKTIQDEVNRLHSEVVEIKGFLAQSKLSERMKLGR